MITASIIAEFLNKKLIGNNFKISGVSDYINPQNETMIFLLDENSKVSEYFENKQILILTSNQNLIVNDGAIIITKNPKLAYARVVNYFFGRSC